jgi:hypothetical protein
MYSIIIFGKVFILLDDLRRLCRSNLKVVPFGIINS